MYGGMACGKSRFFVVSSPPGLFVNFKHEWKYYAGRERTPSLQPARVSR